MRKELKEIVNRKIWRYCLVIFGFAFCSAYRGKIMVDNYDYVDNFLIIACVGVLFLMAMICSDIINVILLENAVKDINDGRKLLCRNMFHAMLKTTIVLIYLYLLSRTVYSYSSDIIEMFPVNIFCIFTPIIIVLSGIIASFVNRMKLKN